MKKTATLAAVLIAVAACTSTPASAASVVTQGTGWKLTAGEPFNVTSASPSQTYTVTYESEAVRKYYAPQIQRAVDQINASTELNLAIGGVEPMNKDQCPGNYHIQVMELRNPMGDDKPGWSQGMPCPNPPKGMSKGGIVAMNSTYRSGEWNISQTHLQNTAVHEVLHGIGLDHPNYDIDKDGTVESYECVATSYGNKPVACSPSGGYGTWQNVGKLLAYDLNGINALIANARAQGLS